MTTRGSRVLAVGLVVVSAALVLLGALAAIASPGATHNATAWDVISFAAPVAAFSIVGGLIATRRPENAIGWLLAAIGLLFATVLACSTVSQWGLETGDIRKPAAEWIGVGANVWVVALGLIGIQLPLRLPDGRLPSPRWRWFSWASIAVMAVTLTGMAAQQGRIEDVPGSANPLGAAWAEPLAGAVFLMIAGFGVGVAGLFIRYRGADELDRVQLRWVAFGGAVFLTVYLATFPLPSALGANNAGTVAHVNTLVSQSAFAALPIAIGYAILRHRLYDIDVIVNRALVYGGLTAALAAAYLGTVLLLQLHARGGGPVPAGASTYPGGGRSALLPAQVRRGSDARALRREAP